MQTQTEDQNKLPASLTPFLVFIACFIVIVFSINQIIARVGYLSAKCFEKSDKQDCIKVKTSMVNHLAKYWCLLTQERNDFLG